MIISAKKSAKNKKESFNFNDYNKNSNKIGIDEETFLELKEAFNLFTLNNSKEIGARELKYIMKAFSIETNKEDILQIFSNLNKRIESTLNFNEFLQIMGTRMVQ